LETRENILLYAKRVLGLSICLINFATNDFFGDKNLVILQFLLVIWGYFLRTFIWSLDQALPHGSK
jgi:hypothetical protein